MVKVKLYCTWAKRKQDPETAYFFGGEYEMESVPEVGNTLLAQPAPPTAPITIGGFTFSEEMKVGGKVRNVVNMGDHYRVETYIESSQ